jgi:hypothetical protein
VKAVLDETVQTDRHGLYYVVAGTVLVADPVATKEGLEGLGEPQPETGVSLDRRGAGGPRSNGELPR